MATKESKTVSAVGTASVTSDNTRNSAFMQQVMAEAGLKAMRAGKSDDEIRDAKLAAREELKRSWRAAEAAAAAEAAKAIEE